MMGGPRQFDKFGRQCEPFAFVYDSCTYRKIVEATFESMCWIGS
jgi:hypothetical protein